MRWTDKPLSYPAEKWNVIPEGALMSALGKSTVTDGALTYEMRNLKSSTPHHFQIRACNDVGYSAWSDVATFWTRACAPDRPTKPVCTAAASEDATIEWTAPDAHGVDILRYEVICARSRSLMLWCRLVCERLWWAPDLEVVFGLFGMVDSETHMESLLEQGRESLVSIKGDEAFYCEVNPKQTSSRLAELLPGTQYYTMVRAVSPQGNGKWSPICAVKTAAARPGIPQGLRLETVNDRDCTVSYSLPHANGKSILEAIFKLSRVDGPLAEEDVDHTTGEPHEHFKGREIATDPFATPYGKLDGQERYACTLSGLLPGTEYEIVWACRNECGLGDFSAGTRLETKSGLPDMPESVFGNDVF